jgi:hypothetical protein
MTKTDNEMTLEMLKVTWTTVDTLVLQVTTLKDSFKDVLDILTIFAKDHAISVDTKMQMLEISEKIAKRYIKTVSKSVMN